MNITNLDQHSDVELIELYVQNRNLSETAMQTLIDRHKVDLYARIYSKVGNESDASDINQELWTKLARSLPKYKDEGKFAHFLSKMASNLIIDFYRKNGREKNLFVEDHIAEPSGEHFSHTEIHEDPTQNAEQQVSNDQLIEYLTGVLIPALPVEQRTAWLLRHESEYWEPGRPFEWHHLAELNNLSEPETAQIFETARNKLMTAGNTKKTSPLDELETLVFLVWTQAQRLEKSDNFTWDYFSKLLGQSTNTMKTRYRAAQITLNKSLTEHMGR